MKKSILCLAFVWGGAAAINAQEVVAGAKFWDNWSVGIHAGAMSPLKHSAIFRNARPAFGINVSKQLTPIFGMGVQGMGYVNATSSRTAVDLSDVSLVHKFNLSNLFCGYKGAPRLFEIEALAGIGWMHYYMNSGLTQTTGECDINAWSTRFGVNFNFNLGASKAWTVALKPAILYYMNGEFRNRSLNGFNANAAGIELTAGLTYHFRNSNGKRYFATVKPYNQAEIEELNTAVNRLRGVVNTKNSEISNAAQTIDGLKKEVEALRKRPVAAAPVAKTEGDLEYIVIFGKGRNTIDSSQLPNISRIASYMEENVKVKAVINGYASPEGNEATNMKIAQARAEAVKDVLVKKYNISADRIVAQGQGVGKVFTESGWNRVCICTFAE